MKQLLKNIIFFCLNPFYSGLGDQASVLMYHSIGDNQAFFTVSSNNFSKQLDYLIEKGYQIIKLSELIGRIKSRVEIKNCVAITFDDGYLDNYKIVFPLLQKYQVPATIFLPTDYLGKELKNSQGVGLPVLDLAEILEMAKSGLVEFMPHTKSHCQLDKLSSAEYLLEIDGSRLVIESLTKTRANIFAYPKGKYNDQVIAYLKNHHWEAAVTVKEGLIDSTNDIFQLPRNSIDSTTTFVQFKGKVSRTITKYNLLKHV